MSVSGLSREHRIHARDRAVQAATLALHHAPVIHYTQGPQRWEGIHQHKNARVGQFPHYADCSAFVTWCLWNGLVLSGFTRRDLVNGENWGGGYTGTMLDHGKAVQHLGNVQRGDAVIYGHGSPGEHTAIVVGRSRGGTGKPMVISHGSEAGPFFLPYDYRDDVMGFRRYI
jgi:hypothetical protein